MPVRPPQSMHRRHCHPARRRAAAAVAARRAAAPVHRHIELCRKDAAAREFAGAHRSRPAARQAALVGCGVLTGVGAALRSSGLEAGQTVAVYGCGGVGLSIIQGARLAGARQIIAIDQFDSKREMATRAGATHFVNSAAEDPVKAVRGLTGGLGVDHAFEAVGLPKLVRQAIESLAIRGTATIVGVLPPDAEISFPWMAIRPECKVQTSRMGSNRFRYDIPLYLDFYRQGRLDLDPMVTKKGRLADINEAFRAMKAGEVARTVLTFD